MNRVGTRHVPALGLAAVLLGCSGGPDPCEGIDCSFFGACGRLSSGEDGYCLCRLGAHPTADGLDCAPNHFSDPCRDVECSSAGYCYVVSGYPVCSCDPGTAMDGTGMYCLPDGSTRPDAGTGDGGGDAEAADDADAEA